MASPYLNIVPVAAGQNNKETTINDADLANERASNGSLAVSVTTTDVVLTVPQFTRNQLFTVTGLTAARNLVVPTDMGSGANTGRRLFTVANKADFPLTVKTAAGTGFKVGSKLTSILLMDGTNVVGVIAGAADTRRHDLSFFFPGEIIDSITMVRYIAVQDFHWNVPIPGSQANAQAAPSGGVAQFLLKKNGLIIGAVNFADGATNATFDHPTATDFLIGDILEITAPTTPFAVSGVSISIVGYLL